MRLLRLAIETRKWELAAHVLILGAIKARQKDDGKAGDKQDKRRLQGLALERHQGQAEQR